MIVRGEKKKKPIRIGYQRSLQLLAVKKVLMGFMTVSRSRELVFFRKP